MSSFVPGDIVEIPTCDGLAYVQVTHDHPSYPQVIRAVPGLYPERPEDLLQLLSKPPAFVAMIPLEKALARLDINAKLAGHIEIHASQKVFPTFRMPIRNKTGEIVYWWLWDGEGLSFDTDVDNLHNDLPLREVLGAQQFLTKLTQTTVRV